MVRRTPSAGAPRPASAERHRGSRPSTQRRAVLRAGLSMVVATAGAALQTTPWAAALAPAATPEDVTPFHLVF